MNNRQRLGKYGEDVAIRFLLQKDYKILERNFRCKQGEIDIIAKDSEKIVFVEVKTRSNFNFGMPIEAVDRKKISHILKSAKVYLKLKNIKNTFIRFDVIEVYVLKNRCKVNQIKQII